MFISSSEANTSAEISSAVNNGTSGQVSDPGCWGHLQGPQGQVPAPGVWRLLLPTGRQPFEVRGGLEQQPQARPRPYCTTVTALATKASGPTESGTSISPIGAITAGGAPFALFPCALRSLRVGPKTAAAGIIDQGGETSRQKQASAAPKGLGLPSPCSCRPFGWTHKGQRKNKSCCKNRPMR